MKTKEQILEAINSGRKSRCIDMRDYIRLSDFFPADEWGAFGFNLKDGVDPPTPEELSQENILRHLKGDLEFAFEKALGQRGISSELMYEVVKMWMWVLDDELQEFNGYAQYGLPLLKAVAVKYDLHNPIGDDSGSESKYGA